MMQQLTKEELNELEAQLSCPGGTMGIEVGHRMNESNKDMTSNTIFNLHLLEGMKVLELGHGNCGHLRLLLSQAANLSYVGLEVSATMLQEAQKINHEFVKSKQADFQTYDGTNIPFPDHTFDRTVTVNTLYFWKKPTELLSEIKRVLKPNGMCLITFAQKSSMKDLPFIGDRFTLYNDEDLIQLARSVSLEVEEVKNIDKTIRGNENKEIKRTYSIAKLIN